MSASDLSSAKESFSTSAMDFALREKIEAKTSGIRDLLLAKAFSESSVKGGMIGNQRGGRKGSQ